MKYVCTYQCRNNSGDQWKKIAFSYLKQKTNNLVKNMFNKFKAQKT